MVGFGAQYRIAPTLALTVDFDHLGDISRRVSADIATVGVVKKF